MKIKRFFVSYILTFIILFVFTSQGEVNTVPAMKKSHSNIVNGASIEMVKGRRGYDLGGRQVLTKHFAVRITRPDNPFKPHQHEKSELWFIIAGHGILTLDGVEYQVEANDLIMLDPWLEHGLKSLSEVTWICLG